MRNLTIFLAVFFLALAKPVAADPSVDQRLALAKEVLKLTRATDVIENMMPSMIQQQMQLLESMGGQKALTDVQKAAVEKAVADFTAVFAESFAPLMDEMAGLYAEKFSEEDLRALRDFYRSDVGKRFIDGGVELVPQVAQLSQAWSTKHLIPAAQKMNADLKAVMTASN